MEKENYSIWLDAKIDDAEIPAWKRLDLVTRQWAVLSQFEQEQSDFVKMKEFYA
jgi:hypothetical protein